jgi:hypothetical protein
MDKKRWHAGKDCECARVRSTLLTPVRLAAPWWEQYPARAESEIDQMEANTNATWTIENGHVVWNETVMNNYGAVFEIAVVCQQNHPFDPPQAFVLDPEIVPDLKYHMFPDGHLCLSAPGELDSHATALTIRNLACAWVTLYETYMRTGLWDAREH